MAWEDRNGKSYYYRKRREGKKVMSEYVGSGLLGSLAAARDTEDREENRYRRVQANEQKQSAAELDNKINEIEKYTKAITRAVLLLSGFHAHRRQWRRIRK